jgi:hypothetical protein
MINLIPFLILNYSKTFNVFPFALPFRYRFWASVTDSVTDLFVQGYITLPYRYYTVTTPLLTVTVTVANGQ